MPRLEMRLVDFEKNSNSCFFVLLSSCSTQHRKFNTMALIYYRIAVNTVSTESEFISPSDISKISFREP